jgi:hypothetical protein
MCKFSLPIPKIPLPSFSIPALPKLPSFKPPDVDFPIKLTLPISKIPVPSFSLPKLPSLPKVGFDASLALDMGLKLPKLPAMKIPFPSLSLPKLPSLPSFKVECPF